MAMPCLLAQPGLGKLVAAGALAAGWCQGQSVPVGSSVAVQPPRGKRGPSASPGSQQAPSKLPRLWARPHSERQPGAVPKRDFCT